jgi:uncharacterized protein
MIEIEVIYALPDRQMRYKVVLKEGGTVENAIRACSILRDHPEIDITQCGVGVFGKIVEPSMQLCNHDRVEIYRPLLVDPKEARRKRLKLSSGSK